MYRYLNEILFPSALMFRSKFSIEDSVSDLSFSFYLQVTAQTVTLKTLMAGIVFLDLVFFVYNSCLLGFVAHQNPNLPGSVYR